MTAAGAAAAAAPFLFASITAGSAAWGAVTAVGTQYVISTAKAHGEGGTEQIQSGDATITTKTSNTLIASSLLFKEELNVKAGNNVDMQTANIKSSNMEQETKQSSSTSLVVENIGIEADSKGIIKGAVITGVIVAGTLMLDQIIIKTKEAFNSSITAKQLALGDKPVLEGSSKFTIGDWNNNMVGKNVVPRTEYIQKINDFGKLEGQFVTKVYKAGTDELVKPVNVTIPSPINKILNKDSFQLTDGLATSNQNWFMKTLNLTPGAEYFAAYHDSLNLSGWANVATIPPAYAASQISACGPACAGLMTDSLNNQISIMCGSACEGMTDNRPQMNNREINIKFNN